MKKFKFFIFNLMYSMFSPLFRIKKRILFVCFNFTQYSDSQRAICEKMHIMYPDYELIWLYRPNPKIQKHLFPKYIKFIKYSYFRFLKYLSSSFCVINNFEYTREFRKKKHQFFIQTYHGDRFFKKVLYDCDPNHENILDNDLVDLGVSGSDFSEERLYKKSLRYNGRILKVGMPRNDKLVSNSVSRLEVLKELGIGQEKKIVLFAPTFRDSDGGYFHNYLDFNRLLAFLGDEYVICYRLHKSSTESDITPTKNIINVTDYYDISLLLAVADVLITDYSSCACDFALTKKPVVLALFDYDEYVTNSRGLCMDVKKVGFKCAYNMEDVINVLRCTSKEEFAKCDLAVLKAYGTHETGESSKQICEIINGAYERYLNHEQENI